MYKTVSCIESEPDAAEINKLSYSMIAKIFTNHRRTIKRLVIRGDSVRGVGS